MNSSRRIELKLPPPPSTNQLYKRFGKKRRLVTLSDKYRVWKKDAGWWVNTQLCGLPEKEKHIKGKYEITVNIPPSMKGDLDNYIKAISDLMQTMGIIENDKLCAKCTAERMIRDGMPSVWVTPWRDILEGME